MSGDQSLELVFFLVREVLEVVCVDDLCKGHVDLTLHDFLLLAFVYNLELEI